MACRHDAPGIVLAHAIDLAHAQTQRKAAIEGAFQCVVPMAVVGIDGTGLDAMLAGVAHDLGRSIKSHGLGVEQGAGKDFRVMALQP